MRAKHARAVELRHLRYFVAVAETENVSRAALKLHVSQPALSRQIRDLEDEVGVALFERSAKALRLTDAGRVFHHETLAVLLRVDAAVQAAKAVGSGKRGEIQVGYAPSLTLDILPGALRFFQESNPGVRVQLHDLSTGEMTQGVRDGKLHVALLIRTSAHELQGLHFEDLRAYAVCVAVNPRHPLARRPRIALERLRDERLIGYTAADYPEYRAKVAALFAGRKWQPEITEDHDSAASLIASIEAGRGVALVHQGFERLTGPRLKVRPLQPAPPPWVVGLAHRQKSLSPAVAAFVAAVRRANAVSPS
jgi:LysR family transcriptional regulator, benzoate and cis,cis-muconate-responsive activator of ben and cat genes